MLFGKRLGDEKRGKGLLGLIRWLPWFLTVGIWRLTEGELGKGKARLVRTVQVLVLAVRGFTEDRLMIKASALVYYTLFAIVPVMALLLALGRGFGVQEMLLKSMNGGASGGDGALTGMVMGFVENYLNRASGGVFVGVGVVMLLWSVMSAFSRVEKIFNDIWQVKKSRNYLRQFTTYFSMMLTLPVLLVASSGISMFLVSTFSDEYVFGMLSVWLVRGIKMLPYVINILMFTAVFMIFPNTKVKVSSALIAGVVTGIAFQIFQFLYINGQAYLSSYNAVYGAFAVFPLLLLWLQISWLIVLLGAELSYAVQHADDYRFDADVRHMSIRYREFLCLSLMVMVVRRFVGGERALSDGDVARESSLPMKVVRSILNELHDNGLLVFEEEEKSGERRYYPAVDVSRLSVADLLLHLRKVGVESIGNVRRGECFGDEADGVTGEVFAKCWKVMRSLDDAVKGQGEVLVKDV